MRIKEILNKFNKNDTVDNSNCVHSPIAKNSTLIMSNRTSMVFPAEYRFVCKECGNQFTFYKKSNGTFTTDIKETPEYSNCHGIPD